MLTEAGPKVIEYNCRFGDPETQAVMPLLESDLLDVMLDCTGGGLSPEMVRFRGGAAACVVAASGGYPGAYKKGCRISGIEAAADSGCAVYCAGVKESGSSLVTSGGRVLSVSATGALLGDALRTAYRGIEKISFEDIYFRTDIGKRALGAVI
jgi:phosphoribosylamine--glycine ligase